MGTMGFQMTFLQTILIHIVTTLPATLLSIATLIRVIKTQRTVNRTNNTVTQTHETVDKTSKAVNSRMSELLVASVAQGRQDERDSQGKP